MTVEACIKFIEDNIKNEEMTRDILNKLEKTQLNPNDYFFCDFNVFQYASFYLM